MNIFESEESPARMWMEGSTRQQLVEQIMTDRYNKGLSARKITEGDLITKYYSLWVNVPPKEYTRKLMGHPLLS